MFPKLIWESLLKITNISYNMYTTHTHTLRRLGRNINIDALLKNSSHIFRKDSYSFLKVISKVLTDEEFSFPCFEQFCFTCRHTHDFLVCGHPIGTDRYLQCG